MESFLTILIRWEIPIYLLSIIMFGVGLGRFIQARYMLRRAVYTLEREAGWEIQNNALTLLFVSALVLGGMGYFNQTAAPALRETLIFIPTPNPFETPLVSPSPLPAETTTRDRPYVTPNLVATATLAGQGQSGGSEAEDGLVSTPLPRPPTRAPVEIFIPDRGGCNPAIAISSPRPGAVLTGTVEFLGTAVDPEFGFFGLEITGENTGGDWISLLEDPSFSSVENDFLGAANLALLPNGEYTIRLSMFDVTAEVLGRCEIDIMIGQIEEEGAEEG